MTPPLDAVYEAATTQRLRDQVAFACRLMHRLGLRPSHASVRVPETPYVVVKARGGNAAAATRESIVLVDLEGNALGGTGEPPAELPLHLEIYRRRADVGAIAHTHQPLATAALDDAPAARPDIPRHPYSGLIDTPDLGVALARTLGDAALAHLHAHGFAIAGPDLEEVVVRSSEIENWAKGARR